MQICVLLILLAILCRGSSVYNFDVQTLDVPNDFNDDLKVETELNKEINQDLLRMHLGADASRHLPQPNAVFKFSSNNQDKNYDFTDKFLREAKNDNESSSSPPPSSEIENFLGSNLFDSNRKNCFSTEDMALMTARRDFESLIPKQLPQCLMNDEMVGVLMNYFHSGNKIIQHIHDEQAKRLTERAFYDTLGGYLKNYIMPVTKLSFYAGQVNLKTVENVMALYQQCKSFLNTNGNGWKGPVPDLLNELKNVRVEPLKLDEDGASATCCAQLDLSSVNSDAEDEQMIVSLPKLDSEDANGFLDNIWLPFKRKHTFNLRSSRSALIVVKFYQTVTGCYGFQNMCQNTYNHKFKEWILENVQVHLSDEQFYPGLGAVLRIYENLRRGKKEVYSIQAHDADNESFEDDNKASEIDTDENADTEDENADTEDESSDTEDENGSESEMKSGLEENLASVEQSRKSKEFTDIERASKKAGAKTNNPFAKSYEKQLQSRGSKCDHKKKCHLKTNALQCKAKGKSKEHKQKPKKKPSTSSWHWKWHWPSMHFDSSTQRAVLKFFGYFIGLILLLLLLLLLFLILMKLIKKFMSRTKTPKAPKAPKPPKPSKQPEAAKPPTTPPLGKKRKSLCDRFRRKKSADEEILIKPDSKSVVATKSISTTSSSTSSLTCHPRAKCIPCAKKSSRKCDAAIIETTSLDCSSSETDVHPSKNAKKPKQKVVTINERKFSPRKLFCPKTKKKSTPPPSESSSLSRCCTPRVGLQRGMDSDKNKEANCKKERAKGKSKSNASSWETMYET